MKKSRSSSPSSQSSLLLTGLNKNAVVSPPACHDNELEPRVNVYTENNLRIICTVFEVVCLCVCYSIDESMCAFATSHNKLGRKRENIERAVEGRRRASEWLRNRMKQWNSTLSAQWSETNVNILILYVKKNTSNWCHRLSFNKYKLATHHNRKFIVLHGMRIKWPVNDWKCIRVLWQTFLHGIRWCIKCYWTLESRLKTGKR